MKCPNCGHKVDFNKTYTNNEITAMMNGKSPRMKLLLKDIIRKIRNTIPSNDNKSSINNFISNAISYGSSNSPFSWPYLPNLKRNFPEESKTWIRWFTVSET